MVALLLVARSAQAESAETLKTTFYDAFGQAKPFCKQYDSELSGDACGLRFAASG
jgi:hypothetical protein